MNILYNLRHPLLSLLLLLGFAAAADPVLLTAEKTGGEVELSWEAPHSTSNFTLQKSTDGVIFKTIAKGVTTNSTTVSLIQSVVDPHSGSSSFYRLDIETSSSRMSQTVFVTDVSVPQLRVFPNPVVPGMHVNVILKGAPEGQDISLKLMDILGKEISSQWISTDDTHKTQIVQIPVTVPQGNYFLIARSRDGAYKHTIKMVIRKGGGF